MKLVKFFKNKKGDQLQVFSFTFKFVLKNFRNSFLKNSLSAFRSEKLFFSRFQHTFHTTIRFINRYRRKRPKLEASIFDSVLSHTHRSDASEKIEKKACPLLDVFARGQVPSPRLYQLKAKINFKELLFI